MLGDAVGSLLEGLDGRVRPPAPEDAVVIELASGGVEGMGELVGGDSSESSVLEVARPKEEKDEDATPVISSVQDEAKNEDTDHSALKKGAWRIPAGKTISLSGGEK